MVNRAITDELRVMAKQGRRPSELLRHIIAREGMGTRANVPMLLRQFQSAFGLSLRDVHLIGGWSVDGEGEVPDSRIDAELTEKINGWVRTHPD